MCSAIRSILRDAASRGPSALADGCFHIMEPVAQRKIWNKLEVTHQRAAPDRDGMHAITTKIRMLCTWSASVDGPMHIAARMARTPVHQILGRNVIGQTHNHAKKICGDPTRSVRDIRGRKFVLPQKVDHSSPKFFKDATQWCSPKPLTNPNFVAIG